MKMNIEWKWLLIRISPKFVPKVPIDNKAALVQIMAWRWPGNKPLSEPMKFYLTDAYASFSLNELRNTKQYIFIWTFLAI